ncbi:hypothetical protein AOQ84DRAFT_371479 [Glonium stellatum]|uniref:Uncharacterized protein n=1 Tax=Glonium stellatum TaxID=574774 RepID=A0A8E2JYJ9_9PEZI|nr:hypothetical protein AOQ84DRAFT_371479 [Glonium stellatum]
MSNEVQMNLLSGAHHLLVDICPSRISNLELSSNQLDLSRLKNRNDNAYDDDHKFPKLGTFVSLEIVKNIDVFKGANSQGPSHFNHMDLGMQNVLVHNAFDFLAVANRGLLKLHLMKSITARCFPLLFSLMSR